MEPVILVIHLIIALAIIALVLVQPSESSGFMGSGGGGGGGNMPAPRRSADTLTRITAILAGCFFVTSLGLAIMAEHRSVDKSILDAAPAKVEKVEEPVKETKKEKPTAPISK